MIRMIQMQQLSPPKLPKPTIVTSLCRILLYRMQNGSAWLLG